jgi:hypothetical protein
MVWVVTLHVVDCASPSTNIVGATITAPDIAVLQPTDANGEWIFEELDDTIIGEIVQISKLGYISKNYEIDQKQAGTVQTVCLNASPHGTVDPNQPTGRGPSCCFTGDTRITLADGSERSIALIREGDLVLGRSGQPNRVIGIERPLLGSRKLYALNDGVPFVTAEHPFLTESGWKSIDPDATAAENANLVVGRLTVQDVLIKLQRCKVPVASSGPAPSLEVILESISLVHLKARHADPATPLYNLLLDGDHAYFADGLIVHNKCFIVSATTGSSESVEVLLLRELRDRVSRASPLAAQLIEAIYNDYYQFSPEIAAELERDQFARSAALSLIVRPLLAWYTLAGRLAFEHTNKETIRRAAQDVINACPRILGMSSITTLAEAIKAGRALPPNSPPLFLHFEPRIREAARLPFASWAILDPLVRAWRSATDHRDLVDEVAGWLASAPLDSLTPPRDSETLDADLAGLAAFFDFKPMARLQLGSRLAAAWPDATSALRRTGFVIST